MKVQTVDGKVYEVANVIVTGEYGQKSFIVKDWNWNWKRDNLTYLPLSAIEKTIDDSGSNFRDGYELGLLHGMEQEKERLTREGIIEPDEDDEEEPTNLSARFELYEKN